MFPKLILHLISEFVNTSRHVLTSQNGNKHYWRQNGFQTPLYMELFTKNYKLCAHPPTFILDGFKKKTLHFIFRALLWLLLRALQSVQSVRIVGVVIKWIAAQRGGTFNFLIWTFWFCIFPFFVKSCKLIFVPFNKLAMMPGYTFDKFAHTLRKITFKKYTFEKLIFE